MPPRKQRPAKKQRPEGLVFWVFKDPRKAKTGSLTKDQRFWVFEKACTNAGLRGVAPPKSKDQTSELGSLNQATILLIYINILKDPKTPLKGDGALPSKGCTVPAQSLKREAHTMGENNTQPPNHTHRTSNEATE